MVAAVIIIMSVCAVFCIVAETKAIRIMLSDLKALRAAKPHQIENDCNMEWEIKATAQDCRPSIISIDHI